MTHQKIKYYPFKVWLTTIIVGALLQSVFTHYYHNHTSLKGFITGYAGLALLSFFFSIPSFILFYFVIYALHHPKKKVWLVKSAGAAVAILAMFLTNYCISAIMSGDTTHPKSISFLSGHSLCIMICSGVYDLHG